MRARAVRTLMGRPDSPPGCGCTGVDGHAGADGRLGEVHRGDVPLLEAPEGCRQLALEFGHEGAPVGLRGVGGPGPAGEDDVGGEGVGAHGDHPPRL
jgi:hypothetical protein